MYAINIKNLYDSSTDCRTAAGLLIEKFGPKGKERYDICSQGFQFCAFDGEKCDIVGMDKDYIIIQNLDYPYLLPFYLTVEETLAVFPDLSL